MKSPIIPLLWINFFVQFTCISNRYANFWEGDNVVNKALDNTHQSNTSKMSTLFKGPIPRISPDKCKQSKTRFEDKDNIEEEEYIPIYAKPKRKDNFFALLNIGYGPSAYLFDYLDPVLRTILWDEFERIWRDAFEIDDLPDSTVYQDPYKLENLLGSKSNLSNQEMLKKIKEINPEFNETTWEESLPATNIYSIVKKWKWGSGKNNDATYWVNKYDFNGDGRLSKKEFLTMLINLNKHSLDLSEENRCINCLEYISSIVIDRIFNNIDSLDKGEIHPEQMWIALKKMNRGTEDFNMYKCKINGGYFRTNSVNDFFWKIVKHNTNPTLNKSKFRTGLFFGFLFRHAKESIIVKTDELNYKKYRWDHEKDKVCDAMISNYIHRQQ